MAEMKVYDEGGRGKKQCPSCSKFCGAVSRKCPGCSYVFRSDVEANATLNPSEIKTFTVPGQGKKQCAKCSIYISGRHPQCVCGSREFVKKEIAQVSGIPTLFDEGGQGKKQCAGCKKYLSARYTKCACGSTNFESNNKEVFAVAKEIILYNEGGKGRKQCAGCEKYLSARHIKCKCGSENFTKKKVVVDKAIITTYASGGHGKKKCPICVPDVFVGVRTTACPNCNHVFEKQVIAAKERFVAEEPKKPHPFALPPRQFTLGMKHKITAPSGECPFKLRGTDEDSILDWASKVIQHGQDQQVEYTLEALKYWSRYTYDYHSAEAAIVRESLDNLESELYFHISEFQHDDEPQEEE